jgi:Glycosyltransferase family 87
LAKERSVKLERGRTKAVIGIAIIVACLASIFWVYSRPSRNGFGVEHDFVTVIAGTHCLVDRCDPYDSPTLEQEFQRMGGYVPSEHFKPEWPVYPPSTFLLLLPLSLLPWSAFSVIWMLLSFGFLSAAFIALFLVSRAYRDLLSVVPFVILLADGSIGWAVQLGQPVLIAASSLTLAIVALESASMPITGTLLLALGLFLKPQGAYLCGAYFLLKKRTRLPALAAWLFTAFAAATGTLLFYLRLGSFAYLGHLSSNLKLAMQPGRDADFSRLNEANSSSFLNLQAFLARLISDPHVCNNLTYAVFIGIGLLLVFVCWQKKALATRPYTILAILVMLELLVSYHRLYDHVLMLAAIPGLYELKERSKWSYLLFVGGLFVYHFSQFHGLTIHGLGPFPSGAPVELFICAICLQSLWSNQPVSDPQISLQA